MSKDTLWSNPDGKAGKRANPGHKRKLPVRQKKLAVRPVPTEPRERKKSNRPRTNRKQRPTRPARTPYDPLQPLTGKDFNREINAALKMEFRPERNEIVKQQGVDAQQQANVSGWYDDYIKLLSGAQSQTAAAGAQVQQQAYALGAAQAGQDQAAQAPINQAATESAALRGTTAAPDTAYQQAVAGRQGQSDNWASILAAQGQAQTALAGAHVAAGGAARLQEQKRAQAQSGETSKAMTDLRQRRGATKVKLRGEMRESEREYALVRQQLGLEITKTTASIRDDRIQRKLEAARDLVDKLDKIADNRRLTATERRQRDEANETLRHHQATERQAAADEGGRNARDNGEKRDPKYTQSQKNAAQENFRFVRGLRGSLKDKKGKPIPKAQAIPFIAAEYSVKDPLLITAALWPKTLTSTQRAELKKMGIRIGGSKGGRKAAQRGSEQRRTGPRLAD